MSRAVSLDWKADHNNFARLIDLARGNRTLKQYANDAGVNCAYLSKISSPACNINVTPTFISKLSLVAANGVTYEQLLSSAGYDPQKHPARYFGKKIGGVKSSDFESGILKGIYLLRNSIFDLLNDKNATVDDVIHVICTTDVLRQKDVDVSEPEIRPGFVVKETGSDNEYIIVSVMGNSCIAISPEGKFQPLKQSNLFYTGHRIDERHLEKLVSRIEG